MWIRRSAPPRRCERSFLIAAMALGLLLLAAFVWLLWGTGDLIPYPDGPPPGPARPSEQTQP